MTLRHIEEIILGKEMSNLNQQDFVSNWHKMQLRCFWTSFKASLLLMMKMLMLKDF